MKRATPVLMIIIAVLALAGCGGDLPYAVVSVGLGSGNTSLTDVPVDEVVTVEFDIDMTQFEAEVVSLFTLQETDGTPVTLQDDWASSTVAWFTPLENLEYNTSYEFDIVNVEVAGGYDFPLTFTTVDATTGAIPLPPAITTTYVYSHGFAIGVASGFSYVIEANDGSGWVDISGTLPAAETGILTEFVWSSLSAFPVPVTLDVRVTGGTTTTATEIINPGLNEVVVGMGSYGSPQWLYTHDRGTTLAAEGWMTITLYDSGMYALRTTADATEPLMNGTNIRILDDTGAVVLHAISGDPLVDDDSGDGGVYSLIDGFRVPADGTYYIHVRPDNLSVDPLIWLPDLVDYGSVWLSAVSIVT